MRPLAHRLAPALAALLALAVPAAAQDSTAALTVAVRHDTAAVEGATVRSGRVGALTDARGRATLRLPAGEHRVVVARLGFAAETLAVALQAGRDTAVAVQLEEAGEALEAVVVAATRSGRRIEDEPVRVEVLGREEVEEKMLMTPGDVAMMLNETSGLRVQTTSPSLGGASVRVQGLRGRYTQLLSDGLPLYGGQPGGLGLLQIPPMDLARVEVIKGAASALYGPQALGGVINLVSRQPAAERERELLLNATTRGGTDGVLWLSRMLTERAGYTLLAGAHGQERRDVDGDGWTDLPGYRRAVARPRLVWDDGAGRSALLTAGATLERRTGGTLGGATAPDGAPYAERLGTRRLDVGAVGRALLGGTTLLAVRGSAMEQRHAHTFGAREEDDRHRTAFAEAALSVPRGPATLVVGAAFQRDEYRAWDVRGFDYVHSIPAAFAQVDADLAPWLSGTASVRADAHSEYGAFVNPRLSLLARLPGAWTARASVATGSSAPTPFTEETEVTGLAPLLPLRSDLEAERAVSASLDLGGVVGPFELNATAFASRITGALAAVETAGEPGRLLLVNAPGPTRTAGGELLARYAREPLHVTGTYTFIRSTEVVPFEGRRRTVPLVPRHAVGVVGAYEVEEKGRAGVELYYTGRQALEDNPYRAVSPAFLIVGALAERRLGRVRAFVNLENLLDVRQTRWDPLVRPASDPTGPGGRFTTDAWTELAGRTINGGVRVEF